MSSPQMKTIPPWTQTECEQCGCRFHLTRAEPKTVPDDYPAFCPECRAYEAGLADAEPLHKVSCPCCGAHLDITHGDDPGEISVVGSPVMHAHDPLTCVCCQAALGVRKASEMYRAFIKKVESECRNELVRGELQGFDSDGPHAQLWSGLRDQARALLLDVCPHGNFVPDPDCGCGC